VGGSLGWPRNGVVLSGAPGQVERYASILWDLAGLRVSPLGTGWTSGHATVRADATEAMPEARTLSGATTISIQESLSPETLARIVIARLIENEFEVLRFRFRAGRYAEIMRPLTGPIPPRSVNEWSRAVPISARHLSRVLCETCPTHSPSIALRTARGFRACQLRLESGEAWSGIAVSFKLTEAPIRDAVRACTGQNPSDLTLSTLVERMGALRDLVVGLGGGIECVTRL